MKKLPKEVFVYVHEEGTEDEFLSVEEELRDTAELYVSKRVGRYVLEETLIVTTNLVTTSETKKKRK